jgi:carbon-monoxide dehydrogenase small subunit
MSQEKDMTLYVNGERHELRVEPRKTLADALREDCQLTGTHLGCEHGVCGACTVLLDGDPVRSCLVFAVQAEGKAIRTVEGLTTEDDQLHPLQAAMCANHGLQCGFCTPGFAVLLAGYLEQNPEATDEELREVISSNLCRCTGYAGILAAARSARSSLAEA